MSELIPAAELLKHLVTNTALLEIFYKFWMKAFDFQDIILCFKMKACFIDKDTHAPIYIYTE